MSLMLPSLNSGQSSLADVLPSCFAALGAQAFPNTLNLPSVRSVVVVVVDGLGVQNLAQVSAHARYLSALGGKADTIQTVFPSTTASALASLTTGTMPGVHGMLGYRIKDPATGQVINQLTGISSLHDPAQWLGATPLYVAAREAGMQPAIVAHPRFADTPLTKLIHHGANHVPARTLDERIAAVRKLVCEPGSQLIVLYISELDECAHNKGVTSSDWAMLLESVDSALKTLVASLPDDVGVLITADHGVVDIPDHKHVLYGDDPRLIEGISDVGGEPRCLQLYFERDASSETKARVLSAWTEDMGGIAWVMTKETVMTQGLLGNISEGNVERIGDIWVLARKDVVFYDARDTALKGRSMIGQHGGMSATELTVPLLRAGGFS
ncbi:hypothetical protein M2119_001276 [Aurantimicrobium minutum]|uniref:alkaline phosphatase family protein n=1 Tax=Aurantimicrobium minutum TaxID=708131 RepID=UPI00247469C4|nr:alkaline phosphatase family protein [Aurantimicrobium minutum]MDH6533039.1 hypothetical protein [Aurantimicrobium minutum]